MRRLGSGYRPVRQISAVLRSPAQKQRECHTWPLEAPHRFSIAALHGERWWQGMSWLLRNYNFSMFHKFERFWYLYKYIQYCNYIWRILMTSGYLRCQRKESRGPSAAKGWLARVQNLPRTTPRVAIFARAKPKATDLQRTCGQVCGVKCL